MQICQTQWAVICSVGFLILAVNSNSVLLSGQDTEAVCGDKEGKKRALIFILLKILVLRNITGLISIAGTKYQMQEVSRLPNFA